VPSRLRENWAQEADPHPHQAGGNRGGGQQRELSSEPTSWTPPAGRDPVQAGRILGLPPGGRSPQGAGHSGGGQERASLSPRHDRGPPTGRVPHQAGGGARRHPTDEAPPFGGVNGGRLPKNGPALPADVSTLPQMHLSPHAGGSYTPTKDSRLQGGSRQAPPPADGHTQASGESMQSAQGHHQAGGARPSSAELRPTEATVRSSSVPNLPPGTPGEAPGQALAGTPAAGHDEEADQDKATDQLKPAAVAGATPPVEQ